MLGESNREDVADGRLDLAGIQNALLVVADELARLSGSAAMRSNVSLMNESS